jgi:hypothetical protein
MPRKPLHQQHHRLVTEGEELPRLPHRAASDATMTKRLDSREIRGVR